MELMEGVINSPGHPNYDEEVRMAFERLMSKLRTLSASEKREIKAAFKLAQTAHEGVKRKSGEPYILHPLAVATIVVDEIGLEDKLSVICALLHDVVEDSSYELSDIERQFGNSASYIIGGLTKIEDAAIQEDMISEQAENFRRILLTISADIRVVLIKIADRLHNMRTLGAMKRESALKIASETLYIYAPLAHRLGLYEIKTELEDLSLFHSQPEVYQDLHQRLEGSKREFGAYIDRFIAHIQEALKRSGLHFTVKSRFKSIYSIYSKIRDKLVRFEDIYDLYAIRIILKTRDGKERDDCWMVFSSISQMFSPNPKRLRDWISQPKDNGYESLHTTVMGPENRWVEVQIRTERMDYVAEKGFAAHWKYKENGEKLEENLTDWISHVREILENPSLTALEAVREFRENLQPNDVFVFTPKGKQIRLVTGSTILDFAYKIHSGIGNHAIGAKVGTHVVNLDHELRTGDVVEVLTSKVRSLKPEWLHMVRTSRARDAIRQELRKVRKTVVERGRDIFHWAVTRYSDKPAEEILGEILAYFLVPNEEEFFYMLGNRELQPEKLNRYLELKKEGKPVEGVDYGRWEQERRKAESRFEEMGVEPDQLVLGKDTTIHDYVLGQCCRPVIGDDIIGFEEKDHIVIHRTGCPEAFRLMSSFGSRIIRARWLAVKGSPVAFLAALRIMGIDKQGMLMEIMKVFSEQLKLNIRKVIIESRDGMFVGIFYVYVKNTEELATLTTALLTLEHVQSVVRHEGTQD